VHCTVIRQRKGRPRRAAVALSPHMPGPVPTPHRGRKPRSSESPTRRFARAPNERRHQTKPAEWRAIGIPQEPAPYCTRLETHRTARLGTACVCCSPYSGKDFIDTSEGRSCAATVRGTRKKSTKRDASSVSGAEEHCFCLVYIYIYILYPVGSCASRFIIVFNNWRILCTIK
jgi:hypothetical protein